MQHIQQNGYYGAWMSVAKEQLYVTMEIYIWLP